MPRKVNEELLMQSFRRLNMIFSRAVRSEHTPASEQILGALYSHRELMRSQGLDRRVTQRELAEMLGITAQSISDHLTALEQDGKVVRVRPPEDRRKLYIDITDLGIADAERNVSERAALAHEAFLPLSDDEKDSLERILLKLNVYRDSHDLVVAKSVSPEEFMKAVDAAIAADMQ